MRDVAMRRRQILTGFAGAALAVAGISGSVLAAQPGAEERERRAAELRRKAIAAFPFERVETSGDRALATWQELRTAGRGAPVVLGDDESVARLTGSSSAILADNRTVADTLSKAARVRYPEDLAPRGARLPPIGEWPAQVEPLPGPGLTVAYEIGSGVPLQKVHIGLFPTDDWTTVPAHLRWGGWNDCPEPEIHVAALRSWRDRFGAELVGLGPDVMNLRVGRRPETRTHALELAREQYLYCGDIVDQGTGTLSRLATALMADDWWYFWWD
jgi:hypothetical protein